MKKFAPRILSLLVVMLMLTTLFQVTVFAAPDAGVTKTAYSEFYPNTSTYNSVRSDGLAQNGRGTVILTGDTTSATDLVYTKYYTNYGHGSPKGFTWLMVEENSNPNVATAKVSQGTSGGKPCLKVDFEKGTEEGTTQIVIGFTVTELSMESGIAQDSDTYMYVYGYLYYNVTNEPGEESSSDSSSEDSSSDSSSEESSSDSSSEDSSSDSSSEESSSDSGSEDSSSDSSSEESSSGSGSDSQSESKSESGSKSDSDKDSSSKESDSQSKSDSSSKDIPDTGAGSGAGSTLALAGLSAVMIAALAVVGKKHKK